MSLTVQCFIRFQVFRTVLCNLTLKTQLTLQTIACASRTHSRTIQTTYRFIPDVLYLWVMGLLSILFSDVTEHPLHTFLYS